MKKNARRIVCFSIRWKVQRISTTSSSRYLVGTVENVQRSISCRNLKQFKIWKKRDHKYVCIHLVRSMEGSLKQQFSRCCMIIQIQKFISKHLTEDRTRAKPKEEKIMTFYVQQINMKESENFQAFKFRRQLEFWNLIW